MTGSDAFLLIISVALFVYLCYALFRGRTL